MSDYLEVDGLRVGENMIRSYRAQIKELEQQLSNSISKDELRELVVCHDSLSEYCYRCEDNRKFELIEELNKLIEGGKDK